MSATDLYLQNLGNKVEALTYELSKTRKELNQLTQYLKCSNCDKLYDCDNNWADLNGQCLKEL